MRAQGRVVEQVIRPTGLLDPKIEVRPATSQVDDLLEEIRIRTDRGEAVLVTTLTKRMAEDLTEYYENLGLMVRYLHSDIKTLERIELIRSLRKGEFNVLIGINLLREGLDIPEVSLVAILDADKEGFLRSARSLIQTFGRAARNVNGRVILYADRVTPSMQTAIGETKRRRRIQQAYNRKHGITPASIVKDIAAAFTYQTDATENRPAPAHVAETVDAYDSLDDIDKAVRELEQEMRTAAKALEFERAAELRDRIRSLQKLAVFES